VTEISAAPVAQSLHRRYRLVIARADFRIGDRLGGHVPADYGTDAAPGPPIPRHVPGGVRFGVSGAAFRGPGLHFRCAARIARSPHPPGRRSKQMNQDILAADTLPHYVNPEPFDPDAVERIDPQQEKIYFASQWRMMWSRFRKHKLALAAAVVLGLM